MAIQLKSQRAPQRTPRRPAAFQTSMGLNSIGTNWRRRRRLLIHCLLKHRQGYESLSTTTHALCTQALDQPSALVSIPPSRVHTNHYQGVINDPAKALSAALVSATATVAFVPGSPGVEAHARKLGATDVSVVSSRYNGMIHDSGLLNVLSSVPAMRTAIHQVPRSFVLA